MPETVRSGTHLDLPRMLAFGRHSPSTVLEVSLVEREAVTLRPARIEQMRYLA
jgi:hypothetical protein